MWRRGRLITGFAAVQLAACGGDVVSGDASVGSGGTTGAAFDGAHPGDTGGTTAIGSEPAAGGASHAGAAGTSALMRGDAGGGGTPPGMCWLTLPGATGNEPDGTIPICCSPIAEERDRRDELLRALNEYRAEAGLGALERDSATQAAAQGFARHMDEHPFFDSSAPEAAAGTVWAAAGLCGAHVTAANLAANEGGPLDVLSTWMDTPGTNQWLVDPEFTRVGLGTHGYSWCLLLD